MLLLWETQEVPPAMDTLGGAQRFPGGFKYVPCVVDRPFTRVPDETLLDGAHSPSQATSRVITATLSGVCL